MHLGQKSILLLAFCYKNELSTFDSQSFFHLFIENVKRGDPLGSDVGSVLVPRETAAIAAATYIWLARICVANCKVNLFVPAHRLCSRQAVHN